MFLEAIYVSAYDGEKTEYVTKDFLQAFSSLTIPQEIKRDNGPDCISHELQQFFNMWGIKHATGILHLSTGQSILERAQRSLKKHSWKDKKEK